jgi:hypothetical protein
MNKSATLAEVRRRIRNFFVGPRPALHGHQHFHHWHLLPLADAFIKWQRPIGADGSRFHFDKLGLDLTWLWWTLCLHYLDNDPDRLFFRADPEPKPDA